jgi:hypothetical protein
MAILEDGNIRSYKKTNRKAIILIAIIIIVIIGIYVNHKTLNK